MSNAPDAAPGPLHGLRVIDLTHMLAGPYATMMLADFGAEVVKIEPLSGEFIRRSGPFVTDHDAYGGYFQSVNRNKASMCLDLKSAEGRDVFVRLVERSDALLENFRVGVMERLGFPYETLREINPRLVYGCIRGFGDPRTGVSPYVEWPAYDVIAQAMGGLMEITGAPGGEPVKTGAGLGDILPASLLVNGVLAALIDARVTGRGRFVDVAMYDAVLSLCERLVYQHSMTGVVPTRIGSGHPFFAPFGVFPAKDGWIALAAPDDHQWAALARAMHRDDLVDGHEWAVGSARIAANREIEHIVAEWTVLHTVAELNDQLGGRVPFGPIQNIAQIMDDDHVTQRRMVQTVVHPGAGREIRIAGQPVKFDGPAEQAPRPAPLLGQDTERLLAELGYDEHHIHALREKGVTL